MRAGTGLLPTTESLLMEYVDPNPRTVSAVAISTGFGATGIWRFYDIGN